MKSPDKKASKKSYHSPELVVYGNIREITEDAGAGQKADKSKITGQKGKTA
jgi:hypothetical protein